MGKYLGKRQATGIANPDNPVFAGGWTVTFDPQVLSIKVPAEVYHAAVKGPPGSAFQIYIGSMFYSNVQNGGVNDWDPAQPMFIEPGDTVYYHYNTAAAPAPTASIFLREPPL